MNIAYNALRGGTCLEDIELRRQDAVSLDALGAQRIPAPAHVTKYVFDGAVETGRVKHSVLALAH